MAVRVIHDFRSPASIEHIIPAGSSGVFNGTELGRATGSNGASNGVVRASAATLGDWGNIALLIEALGTGANVVELDPGSVNLGTAAAAPSFRVRPSATATAAQVAAAINASRPDPAGIPQPWQEANQRWALADPLFLFGADTGAGTGASAPTPGSVTLSGGAAPARPSAGCVQFTAAASANAGLFVFDGNQPLLLDAFIAVLGSSATWTLSLQPLTAARYAQGSACQIATGTGTSVYVASGFVIPGGWGLVFSASAVGRAQAIVRSPKV